MGERDFQLARLGEFLSELGHGRFKRVMNEAKLDDFHTFLLEKAFEANGFVLGFSTETGTIWVAYDFESTERIGDGHGRIVFNKPKFFYYSKRRAINSLPIELYRLPFWALDEGVNTNEEC